MVIYNVRLFGGRNLGVVYDSGANTLGIMGQTISVASLSAALQAQLASAIANTPPANKAAFGGDNFGQAVGNILDSQPIWREAIRAAIATYQANITESGARGDPQTFITQ